MMIDAPFGLLEATFSERLCQHLPAGSLGGSFFAGLVAGNRHAKSPKGFVEGQTEAVCYAA
jgi:hypothetical protein